MDDIQTIFDSDEAENEYMKEQEARRLKAEEKKQIEEMARHIPARIFTYDVSENSAKLDEKHREIVAAHLYRAGYHKQSEWISVEERLPENDWGKHWKERKYYLVFTKPSGLMNVAVYGYKEHDWWIDRNSCVLDKKNYKEVTHWMPLPEPPGTKGGE